MSMTEYFKLLLSILKSQTIFKDDYYKEVTQEPDCLEVVVCSFLTYAAWDLYLLSIPRFKFQDSYNDNKEQN